MIELDPIIKPLKKALGMTNKAPVHRPGWRHRLGEVLLEIGIIVFAILLSIWLHDWQEQRHERAQARQFLLGLQADLANDVREMQGDSANYAGQFRGLGYFRRLTPATQRADSIAFFAWTLTTGIWMVPNNSRFEGLKSSGGLNLIEGEPLLASILDYYERTIPNLVVNSRFYADDKRQTIQPYLDQHLQPDHRNLLAIMQQVPMRNYLNHRNFIPSIIGLYHVTLQQARALRHDIGAHLATE